MTFAYTQTRSIPASVQRAFVGCASTDEVEPLTGVVGQDDALEAIRFGLEMPGPGQHVFVRGLAGTGRLSMVRQLLDAIRPTCPLVDDRSAVASFFGAEVAATA